MDESSRFVYIWFESTPDGDVPRYVGRGTRSRMLDKDGHGHSSELVAAIEQGRVKQLGVTLPDIATAEAVEGLLIHAFQLFGVGADYNSRLDMWKFSPIGFEGMSERQDLAALSPEDIAVITGPALFVSVGDKDLGPDRGLIEPFDEDRAAIVDRIRHTWRVTQWFDQWVADPSLAPRVVIGITGPAGRKRILGAIDVSATDWSSPTLQADALEFDLGKPDEDVDIDYGQLRGRRVEGIEFKGLGRDGKSSYAGTANTNVLSLGLNGCLHRYRARPTFG